MSAVVSGYLKTIYRYNSPLTHYLLSHFFPLLIAAGREYNSYFQIIRAHCVHGDPQGALDVRMRLFKYNQFSDVLDFQIYDLNC